MDRLSREMLAEMPNRKLNLSWEEFKSLRPSEKAEYLQDRKGRIQRLVYTQQINRQLFEQLVALAEYVRETSSDVEGSRYLKTLLANRSCGLYFPQCSTRTFTSFSLAAQSLGMMIQEIRDKELSAMYKGESELDTLLTLANLADVIILRHMSVELTDMFTYELLCRGLDTLVINGGSGSDQHPTQALLELYTLVSHLDMMSKDRTFVVAMVGDLKRSRTARSLSYLLALYPNVAQVFVAPDELQMTEDILDYLDEHSVGYYSTDSLDSILEKADALYIMRIQDEYSATSEELRQKYGEYALTVEKVKRTKPEACIIHPLPRRQEIPVEVDYDARAKYWEAVSRGKHLRVGLLLHMFGLDDIEKLKAKAYP